jgi:inhibitor of cysteine peptidase
MTVELSEASTSGSRTIPRGEDVVLRLPENPTTGFRWEVMQSGPGQLALTDDQFVAGDAGLGAGGQRVFRFVGSAQGSVLLTLRERRAWEEAGSATRQLGYSFVVS